MARYYKKEIADLNGTGKTQACYKLQTWRKFSHEEFVKKCTYPGSGVSRAMMDAVLTTISDELPRLLGMGYTVSIDGLGTFSTQLGLREDKEQDTFEDGEKKRNAQSVAVKGIGFRPSKELILKTDRECDLERGSDCRLRISKYSLEERLSLAKKYVESAPFMRVRDYAEMTGLSQYKASIELREQSRRPDAGFKAQGRGSHMVYVKNTETD